MRIAARLLALGLGLFSSSNAFALAQPNGHVVPDPPGCNANKPTGLLSAFACACTQPGVCNIGAPCASAQSCDDGKHGTCESTMWHAFNDNTCIPSNHSGLDPQAEATTLPETFHPTCALTFTILSRGTAQFRNLFGWYNVTGQKPDSSDLHPMFGCGDDAGKSVVLDISKEPAYRGGDIGFFLLTPESHGSSGQCASGNCCPTVARVNAGEGYVYYSQKQFNPDQNGASSFIHLLTYNSHLSKTKFYFAWEDIFGGRDDDFTDLVTSVDGVQCSGGGETCDTGKKGVCALGVTQCAQGNVGCVPIEQPKPETCNGLDDDCNGVVDNGATCPNPGDVCQNGKCVRPCSSGDVRCASKTQCDFATGLCVDPSCIGVKCPADKVCRDGQCAAACDGVVCPHGQTCAGNTCVDLCAGVACAPGQVCKDGVCFAGCGACDGIVCGGGTTCDAASGQCKDKSCASCPSGAHCKAGHCVDDCDGAKCPGGAACVNGQCGGSASGADAGGIGSIDPGSVPGADGGAAAANADEGWNSGKSGCACEAAGRGGSELATAAGGLIVLGTMLRRRARPKRGNASQRRVRPSEG